ncbi:MAG TPA: BrnT family toxin [Longimicrobiaceae bacterium]|nr:BrnT family toxin [Longimicrobiaceae bacterium]
MSFDWDRQKAEANFAKHGIRFEDAVGALLDERAVTIPDDDPDEERSVTVGMDVLGRLVVVVYTWRGETIRLISARKATRTEEQWYTARKL